MAKGIKRLIGKKINQIFMSEEYLQFETYGGSICFTVYGDCCSRSYFYDFIGADKIINKKVVEVKCVAIDIKDTDIKSSRNGMRDKIEEDDDIEVYGYQVVVEDPEFGELTAVFSFRNASNGYYGGEIESHVPVNTDKMNKITTNYIP